MSAKRKEIIILLSVIILIIVLCSYKRIVTGNDSAAADDDTEFSVEAEQRGLRYTEKSGQVDLKSIMTTLNSPDVKADNIMLVEMIQKFYIKKPSTKPYNLEHPEIQDPSVGQTAMIDKYLNRKTGGFFVDCGAFDGEEYSNSLYFERYRNWTGILIEANPTTFDILMSKNRKVPTLNACLSGGHPKLETFLVNIKPTQVKRVEKNKKNKNGYIEVQCFPLYSILLAMNQLHIDYFSLDVEGAEKSVLDTLPWDYITIDTISIEYASWEGHPRMKRADNLIAYMKTKGYKPIGVMTESTGSDVVFVKN